jgi:predicted Zn-dependent peptidase
MPTAPSSSEYPSIGNAIGVPLTIAGLMTALSPSGDALLATLRNGVRVVAIPLPHLESASVSVFVHSGSAGESRRESGISHFVEHMAFKGTTGRSCQQINLDAEQLGADVNAHTDKDHTAFHMRGMAKDAASFVRMLGDIVQNASFPEAELERERQVLLQEYIEDEEDPLSTAFKLFDKLCFASHPAGLPVIGLKGNIGRFSRDDLLAFVESRYVGANIVVGAAGGIDPERIVQAVEESFGGLRAGTAEQIAPPTHRGGTGSKAIAGLGQTHVVYGLPMPALASEAQHAHAVAAAMFGEGMSSPLLDEIRERRGLAYHVSCSADVTELAGQFVIEASTAPEHAEEFLVETKRLLLQQADRIDATALTRAKNLIAVRRLRDWERTARRLEDAVLDVFALGRVRPRTEIAARIEAVGPMEVRRAFARMLAERPAVAIAGKLKKGLPEKARALFDER